MFEWDNKRLKTHTCVKPELSLTTRANKNDNVLHSGLSSETALVFPGE